MIVPPEPQTRVALLAIEQYLAEDDAAHRIPLNITKQQQLALAEVLSHALEYQFRQFFIKDTAGAYLFGSEQYTIKEGILDLKIFYEAVMNGFEVNCQEVKPFTAEQIIGLLVRLEKALFLNFRRYFENTGRSESQFICFGSAVAFTKQPTDFKDLFHDSVSTYWRFL